MTLRPLFALLLAVCLAQSGVCAAESADVPPLLAQDGVRAAAQPIRETAGWAPPRRIVVLMRTPEGPVTDEDLSRLQQAVPKVELVPAAEGKDVPTALADADAFIGSCVLAGAGAPRLKWIHHTGTGVEACREIPAIRDGEVLLTNMQGTPASSIAEHAVAMMFTLSRGMLAYHAQQRDGGWDRSVVPASQMLELRGKTLLVAGLGSIGNQMAERGHGLGMRVIATRNTSREGPDYVDYVGLPHELPALAAQADVVMNALPLTPETEGVFNAQIFTAMKPTAMFINIGRGQTVVTNDLVEALRDGEIFAAGLDVVDPEPLPAQHPLRQMPNVIITPHTSASSDVRMERYWGLIEENLHRYNDGGRMLNVVDLSRGY